MVRNFTLKVVTQNHTHLPTTPTFEPQLSAGHSGITYVPAEVANGAPAVVHVDLNPPIGGGSPIHESDRNGKGSSRTDDPSILPVHAVVAPPRIRTTIAQEVLGTVATNIV